MTTFTIDAQQLFDRYIQTVRWSVRGVADVDEIENDVREHVRSALEQHEEPVSTQTLRDVLARLGDPWQWIPVEELPWWRRTLMRFSLGPEDWRLAYICFGLTILGFVLLPVGIGFFILIGAYCLARATLELAADRDGSLGARRWLVYPPLAAFSALLLGALLIGPVVPAVNWGLAEHGFEAIAEHTGIVPAGPYHRTISEFAGAAVSFGAWWIVLSLVMLIAFRPLRWLFVPFANNMRRAHVLWLTLLGLVAVGAGVAVVVM